MNILANKKVLSFVGGLATSLVVGKVLKSKAVHDCAVKTMASAINLKKDLNGKYESIKEDAEDLAHEARVEAEKQKEATFEVNEKVAAE